MSLASRSKASVPPEQGNEFLRRKGLGIMPVGSVHIACGDHGVDDRFLGRLDRRGEAASMNFSMAPGSAPTVPAVA